MCVKVVAVPRDYGGGGGGDRVPRGRPVQGRDGRQPCRDQQG